MRRHFSLMFALILMTALAAPALAADEVIQLPDGEQMALMHPGVDGVSTPKAVRSSMVSPSYPQQALGLGTDSSVTLLVLVRENGRVAVAEVVQADHANVGFEEAAIGAVNGWQFQPAKLGKRAVNSYAMIKLNFRAPVSDPGMARGDSVSALLPKGAGSPIATTAPGVGGQQTGAGRFFNVKPEKIAYPPDCNKCLYEKQDYTRGVQPLPKTRPRTENPD